MKVTRRYRYVTQDWDRHGNPRVYLRRPGQPKIRLRCEPGTPEFDAEYRRVLAGDSALTKTRPVRVPAAAGSLRALCIAYFGSASFKRLEMSTQIVRRNLLDRLCVEHGHKPVLLLEARHIRTWRDAKAETPEAANGMLKAVRAVLKLAVADEVLARNVAADVSYLESDGDGFHSWTPAEVEQYEARHPVGSRARLALALLLYTGQRRSDMVRLGPPMLRDGVLTFTQFKNRNHNPVTLSLPVIPALREVLDASPLGSETFLTTEYGKPHSMAGFGNKFRVWCNEAGLPQCSAHGLRKAAATRLAELGCSAHEIAAVTGHRTLKEVERYTASASQRVMAASALARMSHLTSIAVERDKTDRQPIDIASVAAGLASRRGFEPLLAP